MQKVLQSMLNAKLACEPGHGCCWIPLPPVLHTDWHQVCCQDVKIALLL